MDNATQRIVLLTAVLTAASTAQAASTTFSAELSLGASARTIYGSPTGGGEFDLALGGQRGRFAGYFTIGNFFGATRFGLLTTHHQFGALLEGVLGRVRVGGGFQTGPLTVRRATNSDLLVDGSAGLYGQLSVDLMRSPQSIFLVARIGVDTLWFHTALFDGFLGLGARF